MTERILTQQDLIDFEEYLFREEKSAITVEKYLREKQQKKLQARKYL